MLNEKNTSWFRCGLISCLLLALGPGQILAAGDEQLEKGLTLVRKGAFKKAVPILTQVNEASGGKSLSALYGLSAAHNGLKQYDRAYASAKAVLTGAKEAGLRAAASNELAHAIALGKVEGEADELQGALHEVRSYLAQADAGGFPSALRQQLCSIRRQADIARPGGDASPLEVGEGVEKPVSLYAPQPAPKSSERRYLSRDESAKVQAVIDADGCVGSMKILEATSELWGKIVMRDAAHWVFMPATQEGKAVAVNYHTTTTYSVRPGT